LKHLIGYKFFSGPGEYYKNFLRLLPPFGNNQNIKFFRHSIFPIQNPHKKSQIAANPHNGSAGQPLFLPFCRVTALPKFFKITKK